MELKSYEIHKIRLFSFSSRKVKHLKIRHKLAITMAYILRQMFNFYRYYMIDYSGKQIFALQNQKKKILLRLFRNFRCTFRQPAHCEFSNDSYRNYCHIPLYCTFARPAVDGKTTTVQNKKYSYCL